MAKNYPRNHTLAVTVVCLVLVLGTFVVVNGFPSTKDSIKYDNSGSKPQILNNNNVIDFEQDWQKQFLDPKNPQINIVPEETKKSNNTEPLNPTELLGRNFFTKYAELQRSGLAKDQNAVDSVTKQLIADGLSGIKAPQQYSASDIKVIPVGNDSTAMKTYAENLFKILKDWMPEKNETEIAVTALENDDMTILREIDPIIIGYKNAVSRLVSLPVIQPLAQYHLDLINAISMQVFNAQSLRNVDKDPLTGLAAISLEVKSLEAIARAIGQMQNYFTQNNVVFVLPVSGSILQSQ